MVRLLVRFVAGACKCQRNSHRTLSIVTPHTQTQMLYERSFEMMQNSTTLLSRSKMRNEIFVSKVSHKIENLNEIIGRLRKEQKVKLKKYRAYYKQLSLQKMEKGDTDTLYMLSVNYFKTL